jgi:uncharacterized membrane protein
MNSIGKIFARGLFTLIPVILTVYIIYTAFLLFDSFLKTILEWLLPPDFYIPGFGFILTLLLIYAFGLLLNYYLTQRLVYLLETQLLRVPLIKAIYSTLKDLVQLFSKKEKNLGTPVLVHLESLGFKAFGLVTREDFTDLNLSPSSLDKLVSVYIPLSYQLGGYTLFVPKSSLEPLNIPLDRAMTLALTAWIKSQPSTEKEKS